MVVEGISFCQTSHWRSIMAGTIMEEAILEVVILEVTSAEVNTAGLVDTMAGITGFMVDFVRLPITAAIIHTRMARIVSFADAPFGRLTVTEFAASASAHKNMLQFLAAWINSLGAYLNCTAYLPEREVNRRLMDCQRLRR